MKQEIATKWVAALRSGEYKQTDGELKKIRNGEVVGFCCLGVLCDLATKEGVGKWDTDGSVYNDGAHERDDLPTLKLQEWAGLASENGKLPVDARLGEFSDLVDANDTGGVTFAEIANHVERHWERL